MKKRAAGRIRCGSCERVLHDLHLRRRPMPHEIREYREAREAGNETLAALDHVEKHVYLKPLGATGVRHVDDQGVTWLLLTCKCHIQYALDEHGDLIQRVKAARGRGEDVILTASDRAGHAGRFGH